MTWTRVAVLIMLAAQACAVSANAQWNVEAMAPCAAIFALGIVGAFRPVRRPIRLRTRALWMIPWLLVAVAKWRILPSENDGMTLLGFIPALDSAIALMGCQVILLFTASVAVPVSMLFVSITGMVLAGRVLLSGEDVYPYQAASFVFALGAMLFVATNRPHAVRSHMSLRVAEGSLLIATLAVAWPCSSALRNNADQVDSWFSNLVSMSPIQPQLGFSRESRLGRVMKLREMEAKEIALRIYSESQPGYLRAVAYDTLDGDQWLAKAEPEPLEPLRSVPSELENVGDGNLFAIGPDPPPYVALDIRPEPRVESALFTQLGAAYIRAPFDRILFSAIGESAMPPGRRDSAEHIVWVSKNGVKTTPISPDISSLTALPQDLDPRVSALGETMKQGLSPSVAATERIALVSRYFADGKYSLEFAFPPDENPVSYFILNRPAAHCEYYASGTVVLLRLLGVPCRYVVGFVAAEHNSYGDYWIARNRDAHAWVEAWDAAQGGWVTVENTPSAGLPQVEQVSRLEQLEDALRELGRNLAEQRLRVRIVDAVARFASHVSQWLFGWRGIALAAGALTLVIWRLNRKRAKRSRLSGVDGSSPELRRLLVAMDRKSRRRGFTRNASETLLCFADRVEQCEEQKSPRHADDAEWRRAAAQWYRSYTTARFGVAASTRHVEELRDLLPRKW